MCTDFKMYVRGRGYNEPIALKIINVSLSLYRPCGKQMDINSIHLNRSLKSYNRSSNSFKDF